MQTPQEGSPWFWKIFGGAVVGIISVLLMLLLSNLSNSISTSRTELAQSLAILKTEHDFHVAKLRDEIAIIKAQLAAYEQFGTAVKEKIVALENSIKERANYSENNVTAFREQDKEHDRQIGDLRERVLRLEEKLKLNLNEMK